MIQIDDGTTLVNPSNKTMRVRCTFDRYYKITSINEKVSCIKDAVNLILTKVPIQIHNKVKTCYIFVSGKKVAEVLFRKKNTIAYLLDPYTNARLKDKILFDFAEYDKHLAKYDVDTILKNKAVVLWEQDVKKQFHLINQLMSSIVDHTNEMHPTITVKFSKNVRTSILSSCINLSIKRFDNHSISYIEINQTIKAKGVTNAWYIAQHSSDRCSSLNVDKHRGTIELLQAHVDILETMNELVSNIDPIDSIEEYKKFIQEQDINEVQ